MPCCRHFLKLTLYFSVRMLMNGKSCLIPKLRILTCRQRHGKGLHRIEQSSVVSTEREQMTSKQSESPKQNESALGEKPESMDYHKSRRVKNRLTLFAIGWLQLPPPPPPAPQRPDCFPNFQKIFTKQKQVIGHQKSKTYKVGSGISNFSLLCFFLYRYKSTSQKCTTRYRHTQAT